MRSKKLLTTEQDTFLRKYIKGKTKKEITLLINENFGTDFKVTQITTYCNKHKIRSGVDTRFKKGQAPANKDKKMSQETKDKIKHTFFKKGHSPKNRKPIGSERINIYGYTEIKIKEPNVWVAKHRHIYEKENGKIPKGFVVMFLDGNKRNFDLENLSLVERRTLTRLNQNKLISNDKDITQAEIHCINLGYVISDLERSK